MGRGQKWYRKQTIQKTYMYNPWTLTKEEECWRVGGAGQRGDKGGQIGKTVIV